MLHLSLKMLSKDSVSFSYLGGRPQPPRPVSEWLCTLAVSPRTKGPHVPQLGAMVLQGHPKHSPRVRQAGRWGKEGWRFRVREADPSKGMGVRMNGGAGRKMAQKGREGERNAGAES